MECPECSKENPDNARFCRRCGSDLSKPNEQNNPISNKSPQTSEDIKINNKTIFEWIHPLLYWKNKEKNEYKLAKTKIITIIVFLYFLMKCIEHGGRGLVGCFVAPIPVFIIGYVIHYFLNG